MCTIFYISDAQMADGSTAPDFTITDINGNVFNLYSELDQGKTVILDLFATWCSPCWSFTSSGIMGELETNYPNEVKCVAIEADPSTPASELYGGGSSVGDWSSIIDYTLADASSGSMPNEYNTGTFPTVYRICPDRSVTEIYGLPNTDAYYNSVGECTGIAQYAKDLSITSWNGPTGYCSGQLDAGSVTIQSLNLGGPVLSCDVAVNINNEPYYTTTWNGSLNTYETASVNIPAIQNIPDGASISFEVSYAGDMNFNNNAIWPDIKGSHAASNNVSLYIMTDCWGGEVSWELLKGGTTIASVNGNTYGNLTEYTETWDLDAGCYTFNIMDSFGDGLEGTSYEPAPCEMDGVAILTTNSSWNGQFQEMNLWNGVGYGSGASVNFEVLPQFDIVETSNLDISIFPNPFKGQTNLSIYSGSEQEAIVEIYNQLGKKVYNSTAILKSGSNNIAINSSELLPGIYYLNVKIDGQENITKLNVIK